MRFCYSILLISIAFVSYAQDSELSKRNPGLEIQINEHNQAYYVHTLKQNETLYSLARYFKVPLEDLLIINDFKKEDTIPLGASIIIPIDVEEIRTPVKSLDDRWVPLYYYVKPKETLYKISKIYFPQKIENLITRNNVSSFALSRGKKLVIGWWGDDIEAETEVDVATKIKIKLRERLKEKTTEPQSQTTDDPIIITSDEDLDMKLDSILSDIVDPEEIQSETIDTIGVELETEINYKPGIASWDKSGTDRKNLFVMHNDAKPNSIIRLRYPVTGKEITAKVLCPIPENVFEEDIDIVISPAVAIALGALDTRFRIQMDYYN